MNFLLTFLFLIPVYGFANSAPFIVYAGKNTDTITDKQSDKLRISVIASDPDGISDLIGGVLRDEKGKTYGVFQSPSDEGSYFIDLTWDEILISDSSFFAGVNGYDKKFIISFFDKTGAKVENEVFVNLACHNKDMSYCGNGCINRSTSAKGDYPNFNNYLKKLSPEINSFDLRRSVTFCINGKFVSRIAGFREAEISCDQYCNRINMNCNSDSAHMSAIAYYAGRYDQGYAYSDTSKSYSCDKPIPSTAKCIQKGTKWEFDAPLKSVSCRCQF